MAKSKFPLTVKVEGISNITAKVYKQDRTDQGKGVSFILAYSLMGRRKMESFNDLAKATSAGEDAIKKIANNEQRALELKNGDLDVYLRAQEWVAPLNIAIDVACRDHAALITALNGKATPIEAIRSWMKANNVELPKVTLETAVNEMIAQARRDGKSLGRIHQLETYLNRLVKSFNGFQLTELTTKLVSDFLIALDVKERTKKNCRDVFVAFFRWCVGRGYLAKGQDLMEHVQTYKNKRLGEIEIFTPEELSKLLESADDKLVPYFAIQAFAGIRGREIQRLDWSDIDLADGFIEVKAGKSKTEVRRLIPIKPNLKAWLLPHVKKAGPVCRFKNMSNEITDLMADVNEIAPEGKEMKWKKNGLRHSYISYRCAESADLPRVADESGNSVAVIKTNYLKRVKPAQAAIWFGILPGDHEKVTGLFAAAAGKK